MNSDQSQMGILLPVVLMFAALLLLLDDEDSYACPTTDTVAELVGVEEATEQEQAPNDAGDNVFSECYYTNVEGAAGFTVHVFAENIDGGADDDWNAQVADFEDGYSDVKMDPRNADGDEFALADDGLSFQGVNATAFGQSDGAQNTAYFVARRDDDETICHVVFIRDVVDPSLTQVSQDAVNFIADEFCNAA